MMRALLLAVFLVVVTPATHAQQTTADGIEAFVAGDYQSAAEVLKPIAERWPGTIDEAAVFLVASMYESGLGLPADPVRACALYLRMSAMFAFERERGPISTLVTQMMGPQQSLTGPQFGACNLLANIGFDHGFQPATFLLDTGHWIRFEMTGEKQGVAATISYGGKETEVDVPLMLGPGIRFLPIEHTQLVGAGPGSGRRNFVGFFTWIPAQAGGWSLMWWLYEVVHQDLIWIGGEEVLAVETAAPPPASSIVPRALAHVRLTDAGEAEWAIVGGSDPRSGSIESAADRAAAAERDARSRERNAALDRVDWNITRDSRRSPAFTYADADGCANLYAYAWSADRTEAISIRADEQPLGLATIPRTFDLRVNRPELQIEVHVFDRPRRNLPICTDVFGLETGASEEIWRAVSGTIAIQLLPREGGGEPRAAIQLEGAEFVSTSGVRARQAQPIVLTVPFGRYFG